MVGVVCPPRGPEEEGEGGARGLGDGTVPSPTTEHVLAEVSDIVHQATALWMQALHMGRQADWLAACCSADVRFAVTPPVKRDMAGCVRFYRLARLVCAAVPRFQGGRIARFSDLLLGRSESPILQMGFVSWRPLRSTWHVDGKDPVLEAVYHVEVRMIRTGKTHAAAHTFLLTCSLEHGCFTHIHWSPPWREMGEASLHDWERGNVEDQVPADAPSSPSASDRSADDPLEGLDGEFREYEQQITESFFGGDGGGGGDARAAAVSPVPTAAAAVHHTAATPIPVTDTPSCAHNDWDMNRAKRGWGMLRCRVCQSHWRVWLVNGGQRTGKQIPKRPEEEAGRVQQEFCLAFRSADGCSTERCPLPHVHKHKRCHCTASGVRGRPARCMTFTDTFPEVNNYCGQPVPSTRSPHDATDEAPPRLVSPGCDAPPSPPPAAAGGGGDGAAGGEWDGYPALIAAPCPASAGALVKAVWVAARIGARVDALEARFALRAAPRREWVPDADAPGCMQCGARFHLARRRHHCRGCGRVVCAACSAQRQPARGHDGPQRVCGDCGAEPPPRAPRRRVRGLVLDTLAGGELVFPALDAEVVRPFVYLSYDAASRGVGVRGGPPAAAGAEQLPTADHAERA